MRTVLLLLCLFSSLFIRSFAQTDPFLRDNEVQEEVPGGTDQENRFMLMMEEMESLSEHPVNLNRAGEEDLKRLPFLSPSQRGHLLAYLREYGEVFSFRELIAVPGFDSALVQRLIPYLEIGRPAPLIPFTPANLLKYSHHELVLKAGVSLPRAEGFRESPVSGENISARAYPGNIAGFQFRYSWSFDSRFRLGFSGDKDPGEQFFKGAQKSGMDYYSGFVSFGFRKILKRIIIGNFRGSYGMGLSFGQGNSFGTYPAFITEFRVPGGIRPTRSPAEYANLRGAVINLSAGRFTLETFVSYRKRDVNVVAEDPGSDDALAFSSFVETGLHRTISEIKKRQRVPELLLGGNLNFRGNFFSAGITAYSMQLGAHYQPREALYNSFAFRGRYNFVCGADFQIFYRFIRFNGEVSRSGNGSVAWIASATVSPDPAVSFNVILRDYPSCYQNLYSGAFRQGSGNFNEKGCFAGISASFPFHLNVNAYADFYRFPWATYLSDCATTGTEAGLLLSWKAVKNMGLYARYSWSGKECGVQTGKIQKRGRFILQDLRFQLDCHPGENVSLVTRLETKLYSAPEESSSQGFLIFQDILWKALKPKLYLAFRYAIFDAPVYPVRISAWEYDVRYNYSLPQFYGKGMRTGLLLRYNAGRHLVFSLKSGITKYFDRKSRGSGADLVNSDWDADIAGEMEVKI